VKNAAAVALSVVLIAVIALCPSVICPLAAGQTDSGSCCHPHQQHSQPAPCPLKSLPNCPYTILEKSKTTPVVDLGNGIAPLPAALAPPLQTVSFLRIDRVYLADCSGAFLRNRVLLI